MNYKAILLMLVMMAGVLAQPIDLNYIKNTYNSNIDLLPQFVKSVIGNENLHIYYTTSDGSTHEYAAITKDAMITEAANWVDANGDGNHDPWAVKGMSPSMELRVTEATLLQIASSSDPLKALQKAWGKDIKFKGLGIIPGVKTFFMDISMAIAGWFGSPEPQAKGAAGALCDHGGECESGNCIGVGQGPPWTYKCSCDPFKYVVEDPCQPTQPAQTTGKAVGETCNHGGECVTGNCIGIVPGQLYKCSCDPFKYDAYSC
ncbi:hypothetical protein ACFLQ2_02975 [archaeon]